MTSAPNLWKEFDVTEEAGLEERIRNAHTSDDIPTEFKACLAVYNYFLPKLRKEFYGRWIFVLTPEQTKSKYAILIGPTTDGNELSNSVEQLHAQYPQITPFVMPLQDRAGAYSPR